ncbi:hypothetical protein ACTXT7_009102 [Hymenolepis weldensis]
MTNPLEDTLNSVTDFLTPRSSYASDDSKDGAKEIALVTNAIQQPYNTKQPKPPYQNGTHVFASISGFILRAIHGPNPESPHELMLPVTNKVEENSHLLAMESSYETLLSFQ